MIEDPERGTFVKAEIMYNRAQNKMNNKIKVEKYDRMVNGVRDVAKQC
jgi:hypothetical protein